MILEAEFNEHSTILETDFTENSELLNANFDDSAKFDTLIIKTLSFEKLYAISASGEIAPTQWETEAPAPNLNAPYLLMRTITRGTAEDGVLVVHDDGGVVIGVSIVGKDGASVTVKSVTESTESGGSNVVTFSDGKKLTVKNGKNGESGVYVGSGDMPEDCNVQIDPNGESLSVDWLIDAVIEKLPTYGGEVVAV